MVSRIDPIGRAPIAEADGKATPFLARQWQNLIDLVASVISLDEEAKSAAQRIAANEEAIDDISAREVIAGDVLSGGGFLGGPGDIELDHDQSGVVPGTYGDATNVARITIDTFGHITAAEDVPISGGGGGGGYFSGFSIDPVSGSSFTSNFAGRGIPFTVRKDISVEALQVDINSNAGETYVGYLAVIDTLDASAEVQTILGTSSTVMSTDGVHIYRLPFGSPIVLSPGTNYLFAIFRTDASGTSDLTVRGSSGGNVGCEFNAPADRAFLVLYYNTTDLTVGQTPAGSVNGATFNAGMEGTIQP